MNLNINFIILELYNILIIKQVDKIIFIQIKYLKN